MSVSVFLIIIIPSAIIGLALYHGLSEVAKKSAKPETPKQDVKETTPTPPAGQTPATDDWLPRSLTAKELLESFLKENGCKEEYVNPEENNWQAIGFRFQGGNFSAMVSTNSRSMWLSCYNIFETDPSNTNTLLRICNSTNDEVNVVKVVTSFDEEKNKVQLDVHFQTFNATAEDIEGFTSIAHEFAEKIRKEVIEDLATNASEHLFDSRRDYYLLREAEFYHQEQKLISNPAEPLTIGSLIEYLFDATEAVRVEQMQYTVGGKTTRLQDAEQIFRFNIIPTIYNIEQKKLLHGTVLQVHTRQHLYLFHLDAISQSDFTVYIRLTAIQIEHDKGANRDNLPTSKPECISLMVAYDKTTTQNQHSEFEYMWLDAQDKLKHGRQSELTDEQRMLTNLDKNDTSEVIYRGNKHFHAGRYYETIACLTPLYEQMKLIYFKMEDGEKDIFYDICYKIGFSYCELRQYQRAYYFLEMAHWRTRYDYAQEYINVLANGADVRVFGEIDRMMQIVRHNINNNDDDEPTEVQRQFYEFLLRRRGYSYIEFYDLDNAERVFTDLLKFPDSHDYAQHELNYINGLRRLQNRTEATES